MGPSKCSLILAFAAAAFAQDTRRVTEPVIPPACAVLTAQLTAVDGNKSLADADEARLDTARIQKALDGCAKGRAVELRAEGAHNAFLSGPLQLRAGVTLLVSANAILFASRDPAIFAIRPGSCGIVDTSGRGCRALINGDGVAGAAIMGGGTIDGRGWAKMLGKSQSWWELAEEARKGGNQNCPRLAVLDHCDDFTLYRIRLKNSPNFHVSYRNGNGFTAWGVVIDTPKNARNTDGIDPGPAENVTITHCFLHTGDDNVAIKAGSGKCSHMTIAHNHFYTGHGMSIGSETNGGADTILVSDLSIDGADNGIRIKSNSSKGGKVAGIVYEDVCIRDTKYPIFMDTDYAHYGKGGDKLPWFTGIVLRNVRVLDGGRLTLQGFDEKHRLGTTFDGVHFDSPKDLKVLAEHAEFSYGPGPMNLKLSGDDVMVTGAAGKGAPNSCEGKFVPLPQ